MDDRRLVFCADEVEEVLGDKRLPLEIGFLGRSQFGLICYMATRDSRCRPTRGLPYHL